MKKIISLLLTACICVSVGSMLNSCESALGTAETTTSAEATTDVQTTEVAQTTEAVQTTTVEHTTAVVEKPHEHTYKAEWFQDETYHWHDCEENDCYSISDKESHSWNNGEITSEATIGEDGEIVYTCTVCGHTKAEAIKYSSALPITEDEWVSALAAENFYNVTMHYNDEVWETLPDGTVRWLMVTQEYDGEWLRYRWSIIDLAEVPDFDGDTVEEVIENNRKYISQNNIYDVLCSQDLAEEFSGLIDSYSNFEYDEATNSYSDGNVTLTFSNGKLSSYSYDEIIMSFENYGTTSVS